MSKKTGTAVLIISIAAICLSLFSVYRVSSQRQEASSRDIQYVMYLGTNDKDTYEPFGTPEQAKAKVDEVLTKHFEGFTIQEANGGRTNENGTVDHEYTVVILLSDTTLEKVHAAADDLIRAFNQSSVLIQANETTTEFYSGGK
ncbi:MAG: DUF3574 domain-containing protein [Oscillospiraceae bacterium]|nr:DUF3574 domain-containing protein [Oscillospiraceae bacterium]